jgi:hypothetical protein
VLDHLSNTDSRLAPKVAAQGGDVGAANRHLAHDELEAYANGRLAAGRLDYCRTHLDSCEACRAELEDIRLLQSTLSGFQRSEPSRSGVGQRKRRGGLSLPLTASAAAILAVAVCTGLWWRHGSPRTNRNKTLAAAVMPVAHSAAAPRSVPPPPPAPAVSVPTPDTQLANEVPALRVEVRASGTEANKGFALLGPFGDAISETRPEFSWQPLPGAVHYSVAIVDARLHPVQRSPALRTTVWRPRRPLRRGRTYLWQVTATLRGGSKVVASAPGTLTESAQQLRTASRGGRS